MGHAIKEVTDGGGALFLRQATLGGGGNFRNAF